MKNDDIELIQQVLAGDENAFAELVKKYQKPVHALAWRKIGDFHVAEEITQDTFLKVYQRLHTLKDRNQFSGWLYVIATRRCYAWLRKKRIRTQPLEDVETTMTQRDVYSRHVAEQRAQTAVEAQRDVVKNLLAKLKESERTVMTLYYLGEMTVEEISKFLGVSAGTIKSRLQRARNRLQKEETVIREALDHFQISPNLTDNILQEVSRLKPAPSGSKPLVPWAIAASSVVMILLMLGIGSQYLPHFQQPYSLDAQAEMTVELVDAPVVQNVDAERDIRREIGRANALGINDNNGQKPDEVVFAAAQSEGEDNSVPKQEWIQSEPIKGTWVKGLLATSDGQLYAVTGNVTREHLYKFQDDNTGWQYLGNINSIVNNRLFNFPMAERDNTLYMLPSHKLYASKDDGKTWNLVHQFPDEYDDPYEILLTEQEIFIIFANGAFRSEDKGVTWKNMIDELPNITDELPNITDELSSPNSVVVVQDKVFVLVGGLLVGGLYRRDSDKWERIEFPIPEAKACFSMTATKDRLYVAAMNPEYHSDLDPKDQRSWWLFRSTDLGNSWVNITPPHVWKERVGWSMGINLYAAGETLLVVEQGMIRSTDGGDTWMPLQKPSQSLQMYANSPGTVLNESIFYFGSPNTGLQRSIDGGKSWEVINVTSDKSGISKLIVHKENGKGQDTLPILYGSVGDLIKTTDKGKSWITIPVDMPMTTSYEDPPDFTQIVKSDGVIYAKGHNFGYSYFEKGEPMLFRLSTDGNTLVRIKNMPIFDPIIGRQLSNRKRGLYDREFAKQLQEKSAGATKFFIMLAKTRRSLDQANLRRYGLEGPFAVSGDTFYMEYNFKLFRWKRGDTEWSDTGIEETVELYLNIFNENLSIASKKLKLAVSGNKVYVGKRDGHLVGSFDEGNNWIDLTSFLPFSVKEFKDIVIVGDTVFVATDAGVAASYQRNNWDTITDAEGTNLKMDILTVDGTTLYGVIKDTGIYRLESRLWKQIISDIPDKITSLAVDGNILYLGTRNRGMLHYTLEE
ncbi:MAG: sigma-70 family RNA polymerase sigma factor [Candidatus Poribacteria bacterium]|nr:sigma-70 family RNA polymerase sigma factor [Candidatus Poribacteria bacterium]